jgi:hypothetical protein
MPGRRLEEVGLVAHAGTGESIELRGVQLNLERLSYALLCIEDGVDAQRAVTSS